MIEVELGELIGLFHADPLVLGIFQSIDSIGVPEPYRTLLVHDCHMTVSMENYHGSRVEVTVIQESRYGDSYCREICLARQLDAQVIQYGIVKMNLLHVGDEIRKEVESHAKPLGRILIDHGILRQVRLLSLYKVEVGEYLARVLQLRPGKSTFGRTAIIYCNREPAIELLEIVGSIGPVV
jgi:chorismate-pyruvate lyase